MVPVIIIIEAQLGSAQIKALNINTRFRSIGVSDSRNQELRQVSARS